MTYSNKMNGSIQQFYLATPETSPIKQTRLMADSGIQVGDGFTPDEVHKSQSTALNADWHPDHEYDDCTIDTLQAGPGAMSFTGRIANMYDVANSPKTPRSAKGCIKLCVKDATGAITVRVWYGDHGLPAFRLGSLVSIWTNHISNGDNNTLSSSSAPFFATLFPERDRNCHIMVHENNDGGMFKTPLGFREGVTLNGLMTLRNFIDGGYDVVDAKVLVVVKSIGARKKVKRKDGSSAANINLRIHDDSAEAVLGLWGTIAFSPAGTCSMATAANTATMVSREGWTPGETILLIQSPGYKIGRTAYLSLNSETIVDVDPDIPDADWLRRWSQRMKCREAVNPRFPENVFDADMLTAGPIRCLFTIADLDEFARCEPRETYQGYMSIVIMETKLLELWRRNALCSGECCNVPIYANALSAPCRGCDKTVALRLNTRILGQVIDKTAAIRCGQLLFYEQAWCDLLGRTAADLLKLGHDEIKDLADRLLFARVTIMFGWTSDESKAGGRICVLGVRA